MGMAQKSTTYARISTYSGVNPAYCFFGLSEHRGSEHWVILTCLDRIQQPADGVVPSIGVEGLRKPLLFGYLCGGIGKHGESAVSCHRSKTKRLVHSG